MRTWRGIAHPHSFTPCSPREADGEMCVCGQLRRAGIHYGGIVPIRARYEQGGE